MQRQKIINFSSPLFRQRALLLFLWIMIIIGAYCVRSVLLPFILASLIAYVFHPVVGFLVQVRIKSRPIPRIVSVLIIYLVLALIILLITLIFVPQFYREMFRLAKEATILVNSIDENLINEFGRKIERFFRLYHLPLEIVAPLPDGTFKPAMPHRPHWVSIDLLGIYRNAIDYIINYITSETKSIVFSAQHFLSKFISFMFMLLLVFMITGFLLVDIGRIKRFFFSMIPINDRRSFDNFLERLDQRLSGVVRGQLTICFINAILTLVGLLILQVKFSFILATIAGILSLIPIFGSILSTVPIVLVALTISPLTALLSLLWIILIHTLEANLLNPKIMGDSAKIHPVLIILSLLAGERFYGMIGALLAVPIMSIITTIFASILGKANRMDEGIANPVGDDRITPKEV